MLTDERIQQIEQAIAALGDQWSNRLVYPAVGGNYEALAQYLKARRAQAHDESAVAVAVADPPEPGPSPASPLGQARAQRDQTDAQEQALAVEEKRLKDQRNALDTTRQQCAIQQQTVRSDAADLARRRQEREVLTQLGEIEAERRAVHRTRQAAAAAKVAAKDAYEALQGQAARWLRRLRQAGRAAETSAAASMRGDAREEAGQALTQLAALVGWEEAQRCAEDAGYRPGWVRD